MWPAPWKIPFSAALSTLLVGTHYIVLPGVYSMCVSPIATGLHVIVSGVQYVHMSSGADQWAKDSAGWEMMGISCVYVCKHCLFDISSLNSELGQIGIIGGFTSSCT